MQRAPWADGTDLEYLRTIVAHWQSGFDWRAHETAINNLPQFFVEIDGQGIHFIHIRAGRQRTRPLLLTHGWPGSFLEYQKLSPLLTNPTAHGADAEDAFDIVIPSLPGYGFSAAPVEPGMNVERIADLWNRLMVEVLGYERYAAHGSDIGAGVTSLLGLVAPEHLVGIHVASVSGSAIVRYLDDGATPLSDAERAFLAKVATWSDVEGGYAHIQRTKPQTLAYGLTDSPAGLAAWILEKYRTWSDCDGRLENRFSADELLRTISLYWLTESIGPSVHLYYEGRLAPRRLRRGERIEVPCAVALFPKDLNMPPREWGERAYRIERWTTMPRGGHFPAFEEPELLAADLREFFRGRL